MLEYIPSYMYCMLVINIKKCMSTQSFIPMINFPLFFLFFLATHRGVVDHCMAIINEAEVRVIIIIIFRPSSCNSIWHTHTHILQQQQHNKKTFSFHSYMDINFHFLPNIISHTIVFSPGSSSTFSSSSHAYVVLSSSYVCTKATTMRPSYRGSIRHLIWLGPYPGFFWFFFS